MAYYLQRIGEETWLVSMPDLAVEDMGDDLPWIDIFNDIRNLLKLPAGDDEDRVILKLITSLLYEAKRHAWDAFPCLHRRRAIELLSPEKAGWNEDEYRTFIQNQEIENQDYFGDNLSDDSDIGDNQQPFNPQILQVHQGPQFWERTRRVNLQGQLLYLVNQITTGRITVDATKRDRINGIKGRLFSAQLPRAEIPYRDFRAPFTELQRACYRAINQILITARERDRIFTVAEINRIRDLSRQGNLYIMQYRGINYLTDVGMHHLGDTIGA